MQYAEYIPLLIAVVEAFKIFGVQGKWSALVAIVLGAGFALGLDFVPDAMAHVINAVALGLAVAGFYRLGKRAGVATLEALKS